MTEQLITMTEAELAEVKRQAAVDALTKLKETIRWSDTPSIANAADSLKRQLQGIIDTHYAPTPRSVTLSDGSVVTRVVDCGEYVWRRSYEGCLPQLPRRHASSQWTDLFNPTDTGSDWDTLKAFAATVEAK